MELKDECHLQALEEHYAHAHDQWAEWHLEHLQVEQNLEEHGPLAALEHYVVLLEE